MNDPDESISAYITTEYEGISTDFSEIELIASRGHCDTFKAKRYGRLFMLKCLKAELAAQPVYQQMLRKEFEIVVALQHPAIMQAMGVEQVRLPGRGAVMCLVAEWIDGRTLADFLKENPSREEKRRLAASLAEALAYIHSQQVVHRDLKPSNIMISNNGNYLKIIDFGLADTSSHAILKQPAGTLHYMSPEQMQTAVADVRNDIYSLGVIFEEMDLGGGVYRQIIHRCLLPIQKRYQQMSELMSDLHSRRRQYWVWAGVATISLLVIAALVWQILRLSQQAATMRQEVLAQNIQLRILNHELIGFSDPEVKRLCVKHWDTDGDGELSYDEAAAVDSLGSTFTGNKAIRSFDELEYFSGLAAIGVEAFRDCIALQSVRLPATVRFIRRDAFRHTAIKRFVFPGTVAGVGDHFLEDCPNLETVIFESRLPQNNMTEESRPFVNCPRLTTIFVPAYEIDQLMQGRKYVESGMTLETADRQVYPSYVYRLWREWQSAFPLMTDHVRFADPVVERICVRWWDRDGDRQLSISEAAAVTTLSTAFTANPEVTAFDELRFFTGLEHLCTSAFDGCSHLRSVKLPSSLKSIDAYAFCRCFALRQISFPAHLEKIDKLSFAFCDLHEVFIPASVTSIASSAFHYNSHLTKVEVSGYNPVYDSRDHCNAIIETDANRLLSGSVTAFFPRSVDKMSDEPFVGFDRPSLVIPRQVTKMGQWAISSLIDTIICESPVPPAFNSDNNRIIFLPGRPVIIIPKGARDAYSRADGWRYYTDCLQESGDVMK